VSGGKGAWELAASRVDERVSRAHVGTVEEGVATTRVVVACLVHLSLVHFVGGVAGDTVFVHLSGGLRPSLALSVPAESAELFRFRFRSSRVLTPSPTILCSFLSFLPCQVKPTRKRNKNLVLQN
jgi:hypothetical protein